jgi:dihydrofolate reductase
MATQLTIPGSPVEKSSNWKDLLSKPQLQLWRLKAEKARRRLKEFVKQAWAILEPQTPFVDGIHMDAICAHLQAITEGQIRDADAFLLGRVTYEMFAGYWPTLTNNEFGVADKLNSAPKYVVSTTLQKADWTNSTLIKSNVIEEIRKLKQQPGKNIGVAGSTLVTTSATGDASTYGDYVNTPVDSTTICAPTEFQSSSPGSRIAKTLSRVPPILMASDSFELRALPGCNTR